MNKPPLPGSRTHKCAGVYAERFNRTDRHVSVPCAVCGITFCLDARDVEAELAHGAGVRHKLQEPESGTHRKWFCSLVCLNAHRQAIGVNASESTQAARAANAAKATKARTTKQLLLPGLRIDA